MIERSRIIADTAQHPAVKGGVRGHHHGEDGGLRDEDIVPADGHVDVGGRPEAGLARQVIRRVLEILNVGFEAAGPGLFCEGEANTAISVQAILQTDL